MALYSRLGHPRVERRPMSAATITFEPWYIDYHKTMAATASVSRAIRRGTSILSLTKNLWVAARNFRGLVSKLEAIPELPNTSQFQDFLLQLMDLHKVTADLLNSASKHGYTNRTVTAGSLNWMAKCNEQLLDFVERCRLSHDPGLEGALLQAQKEYENGQTVSIDTLL